MRIKVGWWNNSILWCTVENTSKLKIVGNSVTNRWVKYQNWLQVSCPTPKVCVGVRNKIIDPTHDKIIFIKISKIYLISEDISYSTPVSKYAFRCSVLCSETLVFEGSLTGEQTSEVKNRIEHIQQISIVRWKLWFFLSL